MLLYSWTKFDPTGPNGASIDGIDPERKWQIRSTYNFRDDLDIHQNSTTWIVFHNIPWIPLCGSTLV
jgi:hypothetical protein